MRHTFSRARTATHTGLYEQLLAGGQISPFLKVWYWEDAAQLHDQVAAYIDDVLAEAGDETLSPEQGFNKLLGLYENGYVPNGDAKALTLDRAQLLTPYRAGPSGSIGLSDFVPGALPGGCMAGALRHRIRASRIRTRSFRPCRLLSIEPPKAAS